MATLTGKTPAATYKDLLQVSNANAGVDATLRSVEDGEGTASSLSLSTKKAKVDATLTDATGDEAALALNYTVNKLTSGDDTGLKIVQTDMASPGTSYLINALVGSSSKFSVTNAGITMVGAGSSASAVGLAVGDAGTGLWTVSPGSDNELLISAGGTNYIDLGYSNYNLFISSQRMRAAGNVILDDTKALQFSSSSATTVDNADVGLIRSAAGVVKVTDGSTGAGTIAAGGLQTGAYTAVADGKAIINATLDDATGDEVAAKIAYTTNKGTSGDDTGLQIVQTDTASPGTSLLIDAKVGANRKFAVTNDGAIQLMNTMYMSADGTFVHFNTQNPPTSQYYQGLKVAGVGVWDVVNGRWASIQGTAYASQYGLEFGSGYPISWDSTAAWSGTPDSGLVRSAAGVVKVTDGSTGYGTLASGGLVVGNTIAVTSAYYGEFYRSSNKEIWFKDGASNYPSVNVKSFTNAGWASYNVEHNTGSQWLNLFANGTGASNGLASGDKGIYFKNDGSQTPFKFLTDGIGNYSYGAIAGHALVLGEYGGSSLTDVGIMRYGVGVARIFNGNVASPSTSKLMVSALVAPDGSPDCITLENDGAVKVGGASHYTQFDSTGHQTMVGDAKPWNDFLVEPTARTTGSNAPTFEKWYDDVANSSRGVFLYSFDDAAAGSEKEVFFTVQMPHSWDGGSVYPHVHWVGAVADTTSAPRWGLEYIWKEIGETFGDTTIVYTDGSNYTAGGTDADITANKHYISKFAAIAPGTSADGISSILIGRLFRDSANAGDTYNEAGAKCGLLYIDLHYQMNSIGSTDEYTK